MRLGAERFAALASNHELAPAEFALMCRGRAVAAIAGIGHPDRFFEHLAGLGVQARTRAFPDHHAYQPAELRFPGVEIVVMTEKDAVKCAAFADARMWAMRVQAILPPEFGEFLLERLATSRRSLDGPQAA
jgi:tetraacyldisaccharide 4'-kinase